MADNRTEAKTIELWEGKTVEVAREELLRDYDFVMELNEAQRTNDVKTVVSMLFALLKDGDKVFEEVREHIIAEYGVFDVQALGEILRKIQGAFPKASSPAQKRW